MNLSVEQRRLGKMRKHSKECDDYMKLDEWAAKEDTQVLSEG